ncbi:MAG: DUF4920 domain-containing protein [Phycisphaerae bacterium]|nr:DUF4920 domain-containing protein [Phycisphaerae bacterium]
MLRRHLRIASAARPALSPRGRRAYGASLLLAGLATALLTVGCKTPTIAESARDHWSRYGSDVDPATAPLVSLGLLDSSPVTGAVTVDGTVDAVDTIRGAWLRLRDVSGSEAYVRFAGGQSYAPRNALGRRALVHGTVATTTLSVDLQRELATDSGASERVLARIKAPKTVAVITADAIWIQGSGLADPYRPVGAETSDPFDSPSDERPTP